MGPLDGIRVIEIASLAPAPFGCMVLSDLGAEVVRVDRLDRAGRQALPPVDPLARGRTSIRLNLKDAEGVVYLNCGDWVESCTALAEHADGRFEIISWFDTGNAEPVPETDAVSEDEEQGIAA